MKRYPNCKYAMVKLVGRNRATSFKYTFDSRGELFQRVSDLAMIDWCLANQGFVVHQYDASGKLLAESGQVTPAQAQPVAVHKAGLGKRENWSMLELDDPEQPKTASEIEREWLAEEIEAERLRTAAEKRGVAPKSEQTDIGKVVPEAGEHPLMRHVFGDDWSDSDNNFKLQAAARKRGIDFDKSATRDELIEMLRASDRARAEEHARRGGRGELGEASDAT